MNLAAILGWPVAHSLSPLIHRAAFEALELDWTYVPVAVRPDSLDEGRGLLDTLGVDAANVTMPHKEGVVAWCSTIAPFAERVRAVNTLMRGPANSWTGENTDGPGFMRFLTDDAKLAPSKALVLGAGGSSRAIAAALSDVGVDVVIAARREEAAKDAASCAGENVATASWGKAVSCDLVVQATPLTDDELPEAYRNFPEGRAGIELLYAVPETSFLAAGREAGAPVFDGLGMLLRQAELSFEIWTGQAPPLPVMREAAESELARRAR